MKNKITLLLASIAPILSFAADITFPAEGGDLASLETWGESITSLENWTTNTVKLNKDGIYTASGDISFGGIKADKKNGVFVIDMRSAATGAENDTARVVNLSLPLALESSGGLLTVHGGTWNMNNKAVRTWWGYGRGTQAKLHITGGAVMNNVASLTGGYGTYGSEITVEGGAKITAVEVRPDWNVGQSALIVISNKAEVTANIFRANYNTKKHADYPYASRTIISDEETTFNILKEFYIGESSFSDFIVTKGAICNISGTTYIGSGNPTLYGTNIYFEVSDEAEVNLNASTVYFTQYGAHNTIAVLNGGKLNMAGTLLLNGNAGNTTNSGHSASLIISNGVFRAAQLPRMGDSRISAGSNGLVRVIGKKSVFDIYNTTGTASLFSQGPYNKYEFIDAVWTNNVPPTTIFNSQYSDGLCTFELKENSEYYSTNKFYIVNLNYNSTNNCLKVLSGSRFYAKGMIGTSSIGNSFVISNATIETLGNFYVTELSQSSHMNGFSNNWLYVQGNMPQVLVTNGTLYVQYQSKVKFDLPATGYVGDNAPVMAKKFTVSSDSDILIANAEESIKELDQSKHITLVSTTDGVTIPGAVLERVNATLPEKSYCYISDDGDKLMLKLYKDISTVIILR